MVRIGIAGIGFMGMIHYLAYGRTRGGKVAAIATRNPRRLAGDWRDIKGNFGPTGSQVDLTGIHRYGTVQELILDPTLDVIDICLPPAVHAEVAMAAFKAGKHVFCEKPIALRVAQARAMTQAARDAGKQLLIGHVLPFSPPYDFVREAFRRQKFGQLLGGRFKRIISDPLWLKDFYNPKTVGGPLIDLHVHDAHCIRLLFGWPNAVHSRGRMRGDVVEFANTQFIYEDPPLVVSADSGVIYQQGRPFVHGFEIHFERATIAFESAVIDSRRHEITPLTVFHANGKVTCPTLNVGDELGHFVAQAKEVVECVRTARRSEILDGDLAADALLLCHQQALSVAKSRVVKLPPIKTP
jgi:predicted dehydrogenase